MSALSQRLMGLLASQSRAVVIYSLCLIAVLQERLLDTVPSSLSLSPFQRPDEGGGWLRSSRSGTSARRSPASSTSSSRGTASTPALPPSTCCSG